MGKRAMSVLLSATMTFGMLAAVPMTASADDVQNITWMFWDDLDASEDPITKGFKNVIDRFNKDYEGKYHVDPITTTLEEYYTQLNALVDADQTPDVFIVSPGPNLTDYVKPGVAAPLDDYLNADGWKDTFSSDAVFTQQTYDGKIYAVPLNIAAACCYYNKDIFKEAGVEVPTTYDELLDACKKIKDAGYTPITISAGTAWCLSMLAGYLCDREGVDLDAVNTGKESWVQDKTIDAGKKLLELSQYFQETAAGDSNDDATEGGNDPARVIAKSDSLAMNAKTKSPEACVALMKYFTDDEAQRWTAEQGGKIPVTNVKYDADKAPAQMADVMKIFSGASSTFGFYNESLVSSDAGSYFDNQMVSIYKQEKTPEEAFQAVEDWYAENGYRK